MLAIERLAERCYSVELYDSTGALLRASVNQAHTFAEAIAVAREMMTDAGLPRGEQRLMVLEAEMRARAVRNALN